MKIKPILITLGVLVLLAGAFLFIRSRNLVKPKTAEINQFLYAFSNQINEGRTDSLLADFDVNTPPRSLKKLINLLIGKSELNSKDKPLAAIQLYVDGGAINIGNSELVGGEIPKKISRASVSDKWSILTLKIHQLGPHQFKIVQVDAREFLTDYFAYENLIRSKILAEKDMYSSITLKAFETAKQLKSKYDSGYGSATSITRPTSMWLKVNGMKPKTSLKNIACMLTMPKMKRSSRIKWVW